MIKVMYGSKLTALCESLAKVGLNVEQELKTNFAGLEALVNVNAAKIEEEKNAAVIAVTSQFEEEKNNLNAEISELKAKVESLSIEALTQDRQTPAIEKLENEGGVDHLSVWRSMPETNIKERKAKANYYAQNVIKKGE